MQSLYVRGISHDNDKTDKVTYILKAEKKNLLKSFVTHQKTFICFNPLIVDNLIYTKTRVGFDYQNIS